MGSSVKPEMTAHRARQMADGARIKGLRDAAKAWDDYADMIDRNRPIDGKTLAAGDA